MWKSKDFSNRQGFLHAGAYILLKVCNTAHSKIEKLVVGCYGTVSKNNIVCIITAVEILRRWPIRIGFKGFICIGISIRQVVYCFHACIDDRTVFIYLAQFRNAGHIPLEVWTAKLRGIGCVIRIHPVERRIVCCNHGVLRTGRILLFDIRPVITAVFVLYEAGGFSRSRLPFLSGFADDTVKRPRYNCSFSPSMLHVTL